MNIVGSLGNAQCYNVDVNTCVASEVGNPATPVSKLSRVHLARIAPETGTAASAATRSASSFGPGATTPSAEAAATRQTMITRFALMR